MIGRAEALFYHRELIDGSEDPMVLGMRAYWMHR